jgi:predicted NAD/FAD-binding protein
MRSSWSRRDVLRTVAVAAGAPLLPQGQPPRRVGIVGGGMAGVATAWMLDGQREVVLLEARPAIGGNVQSVDVDLDGSQFVVDIGAQYFHPGPYPLYTALLSSLGLYPPAAPPAPNRSVAFPASITMFSASEALPRFVSPILPDRVWPALAPWNRDGLTAFATAFTAARDRENQEGSWALTLEDWLPTLGLSQAQWEGMVLPWAAALFSGSIDQARGLSARAAMIFAARALPANPLDALLYYALTAGMGDVLDRLIAQCSTVEVMTGAVVLHVTRTLEGAFLITCLDGRTIEVDDLVFASSGPATLQLLSGLPGTDAQRAALQGIEFQGARLALHTGPLYASSQPLFWSFLNSRIQGPYCEASMWLAPVLADVPPQTAAKVWKSWITHRARPAQVIREALFKHMLPTPATLLSQSTLRSLQGQGGVWIAGGYTFPFDAQETALVSALVVALGLGITSARTKALASEAAKSGLPLRLIPVRAARA